MRSELLDALTDPADRPTEHETRAALAGIRRRHSRRRLIGAAASCVVAAGLAASAATFPGSGDGDQIIADSPTTTDLPLDGTESAESPLVPRTGAAVAWTGQELIVSGGFVPSPTGDAGESETIGDGAAFDPTTGQWRPIADSPVGAATSAATAWTGDRMLVVGSSGGWSYDPSEDEWSEMADPPFRLPDLVRDNQTFEMAWSGQALYIWRPSTDEMASYDPADDRWTTMPGPGLDSYPAKLLADGSRLVALGTGWPSSQVPTSWSVDAAEWIDGRWVQHAPVDFLTEGYGNVADVDAAALIDGMVVVWGDYSDDPGPTYLLDVGGDWSEAPPMPIYAGMGHPGSIPIGNRILALTEGPEAAIFDLQSRTWTITDLRAGSGLLAAEPYVVAGDATWTGTEVIGWTGSDIWRWTPPTSPESTAETSSLRARTDPAWIPPGPLGPRGKTIIAWTGNELLVYGGNRGDATENLTDGAAYSPSTGQWRTIAAPPDGTGSTEGVWTGSELMVVSAGSTAFYDPVTDRWRQVEAGIAPGAMIFTDAAYLWNADGVHRFQNQEWLPLAPLPDGFAQAPLGQWNSQILSVDGVVTVVATAQPTCTGRRVAQLEDNRWTELPRVELTSHAGNLADCSWANQVAVAGNRLVAWESSSHFTEMYDPDREEWVQIETIPVLPTEGGTGGLAVGDDLLVPQHPASILDATTMTWTTVDLPGEGGSHDMVWTGENVLMWGGACCYGTGGPLTSIDAWQWTPDLERPPVGCSALTGAEPWITLFAPTATQKCVIVAEHQNLQIWNKGFDRLTVEWFDGQHQLRPDEHFETGPAGSVLADGPNSFESAPYPMPTIWLLPASDSPSAGLRHDTDSFGPIQVGMTLAEAAEKLGHPIEIDDNLLPGPECLGATIVDDPYSPLFTVIAAQDQAERRIISIDGSGDEPACNGIDR
jgi:hypothetical protein